VSAAAICCVQQCDVTILCSAWQVSCITCLLSYFNIVYC